MSSVFSLAGRSALSEFRSTKLKQSLRDAGVPVAALSAAYLHVIKAARALDAGERATLERLLTYGPDAGPAGNAAAETGSLLLVVPRPGTISPWSSKATDIARHCGLRAVERVERGVAYRFTLDGGQAAWTPQARAAAAALIHDRMTEAVFDGVAQLSRLFDPLPPQPLGHVDLKAGGEAALARANRELGLALSDDEIAYLWAQYQAMGRDPTDVELMMFAQANSEHCRHKIFNADWIIDGERREHTLFGMIRNTHKLHPAGTVVAYADNAAVMEGARVGRFYPGPDQAYRYVQDETHILMKVETHNHPTAISPFPGAATGVGGEIRDEGATGRGAKPKAGLAGFTVSHLRLPGWTQPWESSDYGRPRRIAPPLQIMLDGPIGGAAFNNEFGRPNLCGYFRTYELSVGGELRGYHKPIMLAGGIGNIAARDSFKQGLPPGAALVQLGGPGLLIGLGGGAASSMQTGSNVEDLDFDSVQRGNPEMQRRAQEVIDRCWMLGEANPILSIHDVGAGGLSNALPELVHGAGRGGRFDLRQVPSEEPGMSPLQIWCNEAQERYVLAVDAARMAEFSRICERERCPYAVVGTATAEERLVVVDPAFGNTPVDMELSVLLGKPPRMLRDVAHRPAPSEALDFSAVDLGEAALRVLRFPAVADKTFLITIGDRSVGGMTARDQMVGPWQVPVADVAVTTLGFNEYRGEAMAVGERTPLAALDAAASARMAVGEALTNIAAADIGEISGIKLSANWMAAAGHPGEDAALYDAVQAVGMELCPALGLSIPVGKDSMSMKTAWSEDGAAKAVTSPVSLIVSAFARVQDVRATLTPCLDKAADGVLLLVDLGRGRNRLGGSVLAQVYSQPGGEAPDVDDAALLAGFFRAVQTLNRAGLLLAYHDRSDGGLFAAACEMAFAARCGLALDIAALGAPAAALFNEELGALLQVRREDVPRALSVLAEAGLAACSHVAGGINTGGRVTVSAGGDVLLDLERVELHRAWSELSWRMQGLRDNPRCAQQEYDRLLDAADPGLSAAPAFDPADDITAPYVNTARPRVAILREQGVNGQLEMAAAFERAGFEAVDVHMSDIIAGRAVLAGFKGAAACGGFSYGDVLGAGEGWAKSILFNARARAEFEAFFARGDSFALGVCNGCQMMSNLHEIIPGTAHWPHFVRNQSEQFEARVAMVEVLPSASLFLRDMAGSRLPVVVSHGEGYAEFRDAAQLAAARAHVALRYVDNRGAATETYPANPNGSPQGITGLTSADGRHTILMPHPERVFRAVLNSWHPPQWGEDAPWLRLFRNARRWVN